MKLSIIGVGLGLFSLTVLDTFPAIAQCVQGDASVQYNISGSRQKTQRTNNVKMESDPNCTGNASITRSVQGNIGGTNSVDKIVRLNRFNAVAREIALGLAVRRLRFIPRQLSMFITLLIIISIHKKEFLKPFTFWGSISICFRRSHYEPRFFV